MLAVLDYGVGNLGSILNMLRKIECEAYLAKTPQDLERATKMLLPGVGAFDRGATRLRESGLAEAVRDKVANEQTPLLGICLGMQLLGSASEEGEEPGLGLIDASCRKFQAGGEQRLKVPHMGWSEVCFKRENPLAEGYHRPPRFYFVHSYHMVCAEPTDVLATCAYGIEFTSMVQKGCVYGAQFHPEKSHRFGMNLLSRFANLGSEAVAG